MAKLQTLCLNCGRVLTNENGERLLSGNFDSSLPDMPMTKSTTWARCDECQDLAVKFKGTQNGNG